MPNKTRSSLSGVRGATNKYSRYNISSSHTHTPYTITIAPHLNVKSSCVKTGGVSHGLWFSATSARATNMALSFVRAQRKTDRIHPVYTVGYTTRTTNGNSQRVFARPASLYTWRAIGRKALGHAHRQRIEYPECSRTTTEVPCTLGGHSKSALRQVKRSWSLKESYIKCAPKSAIARSTDLFI